jgi:hypothetical protein
MWQGKEGQGIGERGEGQPLCEQVVVRPPVAPLLPPPAQLPSLPAHCPLITDYCSLMTAH